MKVDVIERSAAVLLGMAAGYVLWLAGITAVSVVVPMQHIVLAAAVFLGLVTITAFALAIFQEVRQTLSRARLVVCACAAGGSEHLLPYHFSELMRKSTPMMKCDNIFVLVEVDDD